MALNLVEARQQLHSADLDEDNAFRLLADIGVHGAFVDRNEARELLIRFLARRDELSTPLHEILQGLVREHGLFPYLRDIAELPTADRLAFEMHRPTPTIGDDVVFHAEQAAVYERLMSGENVILSAPTSFGKSLVVDAILAAGRYRNAAVVVPTIALMDETRRRLAKLADRYKVITHGSQRRGERNLYVMTQERLLELGDIPDLDFFVIDEFYKLDPHHSDDRAVQLNVLFHRLLSTGAQFYLLGPNIASITGGTSERLRASFVNTGFTTVVTDVDRVHADAAELPDALAAVCGETGPGTLVFCKSPPRVREVTQWLVDRGVGAGNLHPVLGQVADWIGQAYHPDWYVGKALRHGIGVHHGKLPRALAHHIVRLFNDGRLPYLLVTSTLIEGVNTSAKSVIVLDNRIATKKYDYFTFSNIRGRSGRMFRHFVGRVVVFNPEPHAADLTVDAPILSQPDDVADEILIHLPEAELTPRSKEQLRPYLEQTLLSLQTLRENKGVPLSWQLETADQITSDRRRWMRTLAWNGTYPTSAQVRDLAPLLFTLTGSGNAVRTAKQLGARVNMLRSQQGDFKALVEQAVSRGTSADDAMESELEFLRNWAQFKIPTAFAAVEKIVNDALSADRFTASSTAVFANELENLFLPPFAAVLEEYGLPVSLTLKLRHQLDLGRASGLDEVLDRLREIDVPPSTLGPFEREMLADTQRTL